MKTFLHSFLVLFLLCITTNAQWTLQHEFTGVTGIGLTWAVDENVYWGTLTYISGALGYFKTTDSGNTWQEGIMTIAPKTTCIYARSANTAYMGVFLDPDIWRIIKTTDGGTSWFFQTTAAFGYSSYIDFIYFFDDNNGITLGDPVDIWGSVPNSTGYLEVYTTTNGGDNWVRVPNSNIPLSDVNEWPIKMVFSVVDSTIWVPTYQQNPNIIRIYKSTDRGLNWSISSQFTVSTPSGWFTTTSIAFKNQLEGILIASEFYSSGYSSSTYKLLKTIDGGNTWTEMSFPLSIDPAFICNIPETPQGYLVTAPIINKGSAYTLDGGNSWQMIEDNLDLCIPKCTSLLSAWAISFINPSVYKWSGPSPIEDETTLPKEFSISQNYPNPFNPSTKIKYQIPLSPPLLKGESEAGGFVTLKIYDILGNEIATLVNEEKQAGTYEVEFSAKGGSASGGNATGLTSGVYLYRLQAGTFVETKKMLLLK